MQTVERISTPTPEYFRDHYVRKNRPVVIEGHASAWPSVRWSFDDVIAREGDRAVEVEVYPDGDRTLLPVHEHLPLREYIARLRGHREGDAPLYLAETRLEDALPSLTGDVPETPPLVGTEGEPLRMVFLGADTFTTVHYHPSSLTRCQQAMLTQMHGAKRMLLCPPDDIARLSYQPWYNVRFNFSSLKLDAESRDPAHFAALAAPGVEVLVADLSVGDSIFIPAHWHHAVFGAGENISVTHFWWSPLADGNRTLQLRDWAAAGLERTVARPLELVATRTPLGPTLVRAASALGLLAREDTEAAMQRVRRK